MKKQWFVLQTLTGQEQKVKRYIEAQARLEDIQALVGEVVIPTEKVSEVKQGKKTTTVRKFFPGYLLVNMELYDDDRALVDKTWYFAQQTPGVIGFVGGEKPAPLKQQEVDTILNQIEEKKEKVKPKISFEPGEMVKINDGPFVSFSGVIEEVDPERGKLKVSVSIFGRSAPVELEYWQVEREA